MKFENLTLYNCNRMRRRIEVEVRKLGTEIYIERDKYEPDGLNGFNKKGTENVFKGKAVLLKTASANEVIAEGGRKVTVTANLIIPFVDSLKINKGDYFTFEDRTYYVYDCVNVNNLDVYFYVNLVGSLNELNGYG